MSEDASGPEDADTRIARRTLFTIFWVVIALVVGVVASCAIASGGSDDDLTVTRETANDQGWQWPLTVDTVDLVCMDNGGVAALSAGTSYALNGTAKSSGMASIEPIWANSTEVDGVKVDISGLTNYALNACG